MNGYSLTKDWFAFTKENLGDVNCNHTAMYLYIVEFFNTHDWVEILGIPSDYTMAVLNIRSYKTYKKVFDDLVRFGFIKVVEKSKNQYTSTKISLINASVNNTKAKPKQRPKQSQSKCSIYKLLNKETIKQIEENSKLVCDNIEKWIKHEKENNNSIVNDTNHQHVKFCDEFYEVLIKLNKISKSKKSNESDYEFLKSLIEDDCVSFDSIKNVCEFYFKNFSDFKSKLGYFVKVYSLKELKDKWFKLKDMCNELSVNEKEAV